MAGSLSSRFLCLFTVSLLLLTSPTWVAAQTLQERVAGANRLPDLKFPDEVKSLSFFSPLTMAIYKPDGVGPFPALIVLPSCAGLRTGGDRRDRTELRDWTKAALAEKYVVFVVDPLGPRGVENNCYPPLKVTFFRQAKDAFQALEHLKRFDFVDQNRVALIGFSMGATVGLLVSSRELAEAFRVSKRFAAVASFYPLCKIRAFDFVREDVDRPLLVLMGELDNETPPGECLPQLEVLKQRDAPVSWHLYPKTGHCWDCSSVDNHSKTDFRGNRVVYRFDKDVTKDSARRAFEFFAKQLTVGTIGGRE